MRMRVGMGVRLRGPRLAVAGALDMPSEALPRGAVQVPGHGDPIVLLADHQTTGGYPKIAVLASADQDGFAQLRSREAVAFRAVSAEQAVAAAVARQGAVRRYLEALSDAPVEEQARAVVQAMVGDPAAPRVRFELLS